LIKIYNFINHMKIAKNESKNLESEYLMNLMASHSSSLPYLSEAMKEK